MILQSFILSALLIVTLYARPTAASPAVRYAITDLGTLGGYYTFATAINNAGTVVGSSQTAHQTHGRMPYRYIVHAFSWKEGRIRDLGTLGGDFSGARAINDWGEIVGVSELDLPYPAGDRHRCAFLYSHGKMRDLGTLPGNAWSVATGINAQGKIVGIVGTGYSDSMGVIIQQAVIWSGGKIRALGYPPSEAYGINFYGLVVGKELTNRFGPAEWAPASKFGVGLAADGCGYAHAINARGQVVGEDSGKAFGEPRQPFLSEADGIAYDLPCLPGQNGGAAKAVNNLGVAVGVSGVACLWKECIVTDLNTLIPPNSGWKLTDATGINDHGQICGNGSYHGEPHAFLLTPLPNQGESI